MLLRVCCAMLLCMRSRLLGGDFAANLKLLQHYPEINIEHLLQVAQELRDLSPVVIETVWVSIGVSRFNISWIWVIMFGNLPVEDGY
ncbi:hypothetical protein BVC80_787g10 [Macleaya cordata]|uniref:Uncharacterized protein n=1 Tax=Macleaya cordata TaxID=56857 RepID=A0A200Q880_MACCD|nr:hypothetical protein BVC80_787g10 [Macleaya cordata]